MVVLKNNKVRIWGTVTKDVGEKLEEWSVRLGIPKTYLVALAVTAGMGVVIRGIAPEEILKPGQLAEIVKAMNGWDKNKEGKDNE